MLSTAYNYVRGIVKWFSEPDTMDEETRDQLRHEMEWVT